MSFFFFFGQRGKRLQNLTFAFHPVKFYVLSRKHESNLDLGALQILPLIFNTEIHGRGITDRRMEASTERHRNRDKEGRIKEDKKLRGERDASSPCF